MVRARLVPLPNDHPMDVALSSHRMGRRSGQAHAPAEYPRSHARLVAALPSDQWARPEELQGQSRQVAALSQRDPQRSIIDIFAEVQRSPSPARTD